jgi:hypothetical protein
MEAQSSPSAESYLHVECDGDSFTMTVVEPAKPKPAASPALPAAHLPMPGYSPASLGERLNWQAAQPMQPKRNQRPLDIGFWNPMRSQIELF